MRPRRFHITVRSALVAFLLLGGLQSVLLSVHNPLGAVTIRGVNWLISKTSPDSLKLNGAGISWPYFWEEMAIGLVLLALALGIGAGLRPSSAGQKNLS